MLSCSQFTRRSVSPSLSMGIFTVPYIRNVSGMIVANTGSVSLCYDGERRAAYFLLDNLKPAIRRVDYNLDCELKALSGCGLPHSDPHKRHSPDAITIAPAHGTQVKGCFQVLIS